MSGDPTYQNITATVRPPRCVIFINRNSKYWKAAADGAIAKASEVWGGRYFLIIPTDGESIGDKLWELLETYSPDHLAVFDLTFSDLEYADPSQHQATKQRYKDGWEAKGNSVDDFEDWFAKSADQSRVDMLSISDDLSKELIYRLSPFHFSAAVDKHITRSSGFGYPFTKIAKIASAATRHIGLVRLPPPIEDPAMQLLIHSETGVSSKDHYADAGFIARPLPDSYEILDLLKHLGSSRPPDVNHDEEPRLDGSFLPNTPFGLSMLHLGQYYRADRHMAHKEPVVVVLGDTVDDFCLYYSLSRMHEGVKWLPLAWLRACTKALNERRARREQEEEPRKFTQEAEVGRVLVNLFYELIEYGHDEKRVQLCSMSLNQRQLVAYRTQVARCSYFGTDEVTSHIDCIPIEAVSTSCILRVFETNNYVNHRSMVFVDGSSVSPFDTPAVKNFSEIRLPDHYWLTSLRIEGYQPPSLPTLGPKIVSLHNSTTESRVANDGIVYQCPNSMIFSSELDAVLVRPKVEMPGVITLFDTYFEGVGVNVKYSDKGNYFVDTLRRFGGLESAGRFIKAPATRSVLDKFMSKKVADDGNIIYLDNDQRAYLNLNAITGSLGDEKVAADLVDDLVGKQVIQRGYIFQCLRCRLVSWYGMDVLATDFVCNRCSLRQQFTREHWRSPFVPHWYYRLAETVYQFYRNNSHLTAQVLYKLKSESQTAFHYAPEIDLVNFPRKGKSREMDVACIQDGAIIFGECKTQPLHPDDAEKFETLVGMPLKNPARIIFATTQPVSEQFKARMSGLPNAEILTRGDLYDD
ncbi:hypothetical protein J7I98_14570 [Streptomyces sp. ISL-98]|uniref:hypothetical protein n=1 Tax=Streptomyces sp. ISL-98 TaxID=2819192 RepID=UPI001BE66075|nr:hypothetical protein [Streptomyces sp. ISL-98]MBT2507090.1 hypothetical protein [Streptomyces sp. ISL-98]